MTHRRSGFTLLELILVLALMAMLAAMLYPSFESMFIGVRVNAAADHLRSKFAEARAHAIDEVRPYRFAVKAGQSGYRLAPDTSDNWSDSTTPPDSSNPGTVLEDQLPGGIQFNLGTGAGTPDSNGWTTILTFQFDGSCDADKTIRLDLDGARPVEISVRSMTGSVSARALKLGEGK